MCAESLNSVVDPDPVSKWLWGESAQATDSWQERTCELLWLVQGVWGGQPSRTGCAQSHCFDASHA